MKAIVNTRYGPPEAVKLMEVDKPAPKDNEVLIKIYATTVNRTDCGFRKPEYPLIIRLSNGLFRPKRTILGSELAGEIEMVGKDVKSFRQGDQVFGLTDINFGTHAEYICLPETAPIAAKPDNMNFEEAAAVCDGAMLALSGLRLANVQAGHEILVYGASGSIGIAAVQLAAHFGAKIMAVCNTRNLEMVKSLGAEEVMDYTKEDFTKINKTFNVVFDAVGKCSFFRCKGLLKPGGYYLTTDLGFLSHNLFLILLTSIIRGKKVRLAIPKFGQQDIRMLKELIEAGKYKAVIDRRYPLEQIVEAYRYVETGQKTGNVVITLRNY